MIQPILKVEFSSGSAHLFPAVGGKVNLDLINSLTLLKSLGLVGRNDFGVPVLPEEKDWTEVAPVQT